ncbi:MAG: REP-associated tyrosine transposase [Candidatus Binatia bacterium]
MARPVRIEYPGALYHVITRGNNRQFIFRDDRDRRRYLEKLSLYCHDKEVHLLCYCLLTNHVHLLLETPRGNLSKMMQPFQTSYTVYFNKRHHRSGHVFEQRYKAFLVDKDNYLLQVSRYIHLNPVQAKLVQKPQDYRWSSYRSYVSEKPIHGVNSKPILDQFGGSRGKRVREYRDFVEGEVKAARDWSKLPILRQAFIGDEDFIARVTSRAKKRSLDGEQRYSLKDIVSAVCRVTGIEAENLRKISKDPRIQEARELLMYVARRYSGASLREMLPHLGARDISTVSHGVKRAENRLIHERVFRDQVGQVLERLNRLTS